MVRRLLELASPLESRGGSGIYRSAGRHTSKHTLPQRFQHGVAGLGLVIVEADLVETGRDSKQWSMLLRSAQGKKLDCFEAAALLFVMAYVFPMSMCGTPLFEQA